MYHCSSSVLTVASSIDLRRSIKCAETTRACCRAISAAVKRHIAEIEAYLKKVDAILPNAIVVAFSEVVEFAPLQGPPYGVGHTRPVQGPTTDTRGAKAGVHRRRSAAGHSAGGT